MLWEKKGFSMTEADWSRPRHQLSRSRPRQWKFCLEARQCLEAAHHCWNQRH